MAALRLANAVYSGDEYQRFSNLVDPRATNALAQPVDANRERVRSHATLRWLLGVSP